MDMAVIDLSISDGKDFSVRPELVEGWTEKSWRSTWPSRPCFDYAQHERLGGKRRFWKLFLVEY